MVLLLTCLTYMVSKAKTQGAFLSHSTVVGPIGKCKAWNNLFLSLVLRWGYVIDTNLSNKPMMSEHHELIFLKQFSKTTCQLNQEKQWRLFRNSPSDFLWTPNVQEFTLLGLPEVQPDVFIFGFKSVWTHLTMARQRGHLKNPGLVQGNVFYQRIGGRLVEPNLGRSGAYETSLLLRWTPLSNSPSWWDQQFHCEVTAVNWGQWHGPYATPSERLAICASGKVFLWKRGLAVFDTASSGGLFLLALQKKTLRRQSSSISCC